MSETTLTLRGLFHIDPQGISVRANAAFDAQEAAEKFRQEIAKGSPVIRWPWVRQAVVDQSSRLLDLNVLEVLGEAWKKVAEIEEYADPRKHDPEEKNLVPLADHTIHSEHHPALEIL